MRQILTDDQRKGKTGFIVVLRKQIQQNSCKPAAIHCEVANEEDRSV